MLTTPVDYGWLWGVLSLPFDDLLRSVSALRGYRIWQYAPNIETKATVDVGAGVNCITWDLANDRLVSVSSMANA